MKHIKTDLAIPAFDWSHAKLLDGAYCIVFDYLVHLVDTGLCDIKIPFFLVRGASEEAVRKEVELFFICHYGEYEKYQEHIVYLHNDDTYTIDAKMMLFVHVKFLTNILGKLEELGKNVQQDILGNAEIVVSRRYDDEQFAALLENYRHLFEYKNKTSLLLPLWEKEYSYDMFDEVFYHDFGVNYKNYHTIGSPDVETHLINVNYNKYIDISKEYVDKLIAEKNVVWLANCGDKRLDTLPHRHLITDDSNVVYSYFSQYTHYHFIEPRWQCSNGRMVIETLYLGKELIYNRPVDFKDEAWYKYNKGKYDNFYFDINEVDVPKLLERMK